MEIKIDFKYLLLALAFLVGSVLYGLNKFSQAKKYLSMYEDLFETNENLKSTFTTIQKEKIKLNDLLNKSEILNSELNKEIIFLKSKKQKIKYIDIIKYETKEVVIAYQNIPDSHLFLTEYDLPICSFVSSSTYEFKVLPVDYTLNVIHTDKESKYKMIAHSYHNNKDFEVPINLNESKVVEIKDYPMLALNFSAGISLNYSTNFNISPVLGFPFIHVSDSLDVLSPEITFVNNSLKPGVSFLDYKISEKMSLLQDTWLGFNYSKDLNNNYLGITIKSKF